MSSHDDQPPTLTRSRLVREELRHLLEGLTERTTPIDFADLARCGVLQKAPHEHGWYLILKPAELPPKALEQATGAGLTRIGGRWMPMLKFNKTTNSKVAALL